MKNRLMFFNIRRYIYRKKILLFQKGPLRTIEDRGKESTAIFSFIKGGIHYGNSA